MHISDSFAARLRDRFNGRYRVRWSRATNEYHLEQRVGRAFWAGTKAVDPEDDTAIRRNDAQVLIARIRPGDRFPCKRCKATLKAPVRVFKEVKCGTCAAPQGIVCHFPLDDLLLDYISELERGVDAKRFDTENRNAVESRHAAARDAALYGFSNNWHRIRGNPRIGMYG